MSRLFSLRDWLAIRSLEKHGEQLDLERALLWPQSSWVAALGAPIPFMSFGVETFITTTTGNHQRVTGMLQARMRQGRPETIITLIAPSLREVEKAAPIWYRLINELGQADVERGVQRIFAQTAYDPRTDQVLSQCGFTTYAREDIFQLAVPPLSPAPKLTLRHQNPRDQWNLMRLYNQTTPRAVQHAEGSLLPDEGKSGRANIVWDPRARGSLYVMQANEKLIGAVRLARGLTGYWMRFWLNPEAATQARALIFAAMNLVRVSERRPVYVPVRDYDSNIRPLLYELGLQCLLTRSLMVKHTTAFVREPERIPQFATVLEKSGM